ATRARRRDFKIRRKKLENRRGAPEGFRGRRPVRSLAQPGRELRRLDEQDRVVPGEAAQGRGEDVQIAEAPGVTERALELFRHPARGRTAERGTQKRQHASGPANGLAILVNRLLGVLLGRWAVPPS